MSAPTNDRPSLGFSDELDNLNSAEFAVPKKAFKPSPETVEKAAQAAGFRSRENREPPPPVAKVQQRRRRTGRNVQFNIKTTAETIEAFTRIADAKGWGLGEAFEHATVLLEKEHGTR